MAWVVTTAGASLEFNTTDCNYNSSVLIDANHVINFYMGGGNDGFVVVLAINTTTWAVTTASAELEFDGSDGAYNSAQRVDTNHFINFWLDTGSIGRAQVFEVDTTTWAVTTANSSLAFVTAQSSGNGTSCVLDTNHFMTFWWGNGGDGETIILTVNTSTWAVTTAVDIFTFDTVATTAGHSPVTIDDTHVIDTFFNATDMVAQVFAINTTTWAISTASAPFTFSSGGLAQNELIAIDANHLLALYGDGASDGFAQVLTVNTTTWAVTTASAVFKIDDDDFNAPTAVKLDANHFLIAYGDSTVETGGIATILEINTSTWAVTTATTELVYETTTNSKGTFLTEINEGHYLNAWGGALGDGFAQVFTVTGFASGATPSSFGFIY